MLYQNFFQRTIKYNGLGIKKNIKISDNQIYYDKNKVLKCPKCNNLIFYVENYY